MQTSKKHISGPVQAILALVLFIILGVCISLIITSGFEKKVNTSEDYNCIFEGASLVAWGIDSDIYNDVTGARSVKLATAGCSMLGRNAVIKNAISRYPVDTVIMDVTTITLPQDNFTRTPDPDLYAMYRLNTLKEKIDYLTKAFSFKDDEYDALYGNWLDCGLLSWKDIRLGLPVNYWITDSNEEKESHDQTLAAEEYEALAGTAAIDNEFLRERVDLLVDTINSCKNRGVRFVMIVLPVSSRELITNTGWDEFHAQLSDIAAANDIEFYDLNLLKERAHILPDETAFYDATHLSGSGQNTVTPILADIVTRGEHEDISELFYDSYEEMMKDQGIL